MARRVTRFSLDCHPSTYTNRARCCLTSLSRPASFVSATDNTFINTYYASYNYFYVTWTARRDVITNRSSATCLFCMTSRRTINRQSYRHVFDSGRGHSKCHYCTYVRDGGYLMEYRYLSFISGQVFLLRSDRFDLSKRTGHPTFARAQHLIYIYMLIL